MQYTPLPERALLAISGADRADFLQGLISNDIRRLEKQNSLYAALLSPQGKYLHDFFVIADGERILIDIERPRLPDLANRLNLYKLRSKVAIEHLDTPVLAAWGEAASSTGFADPRLSALGFRHLGAPDAHWGLTSPEEYDRMRLELGVPVTGDFLVDKTFLLEAHFEALNGVDFNKGCYVGQEVTARSKFRGQVRKGFYKITGQTELPEPGTAITANGQEAGEIRSHNGSVGIGILRSEKLQDASHLEAGGQKISAILPAWAAENS